MSRVLALSVAKRHGLIEAGNLFPPGRGCRELSVAKRHGLIEAMGGRTYEVNQSRLSVAKRHGLIEAEYTVEPLIEPAEVIRGKTPRPH